VTFNCGDTFFIEDEDGYERHLWIIVTPPTKDEMVVVNVTTRRQRSETLVELHKGDHPFITRDSVISYAYAKIINVEEIESAIKNGTAEKSSPASATLLSRAQAGLIDSDRTPNGVKHYYKSVKQ
jgi:mRNA-degrading endonuclease toxin of MazEF toxin-antitoxin module